MKADITTADDKIRDIHALMQSASKNIFVERHTLALWGVTIGLIIALSGTLTRSLYNRDFWLGLTVEHLAIGLLLFIVIMVDYRLTRANKVRRDETFSLVQKRISFVVWMLFLLSFLLGLYSVMKLGGGVRVLSMHVIVAGIAILIIGQFSSLWYRWAGSSFMLLGVMTLFLFYPGTTLRIFVASSFIAGGIFCSLLAPYASSHLRCFVLVLVKITLIVLTTIVVQIGYDRVMLDPGDLPRVSYQHYIKQPAQGKKIVVLPAGSELYLQLSVDADVLAGSVSSKSKLLTNRELELVVNNGIPTGIFRVSGSPWLDIKNALYVKRFVRQFRMTGDKGPVVIRNIYFSTRRRYGGLTGK